jgi:hypothetical protein
MVPSLMIAAAAFAGFLIVLLAIAYAGFRLSARRETPLGAAGGCALAAVLLGATFFAFIGLAVFFAFFFVHEHKDEIRDGWRQHLHERDSFERRWDVAPSTPEAPEGDDAPDAPEEPADRDGQDGDLREY